MDVEKRQFNVLFISVFATMLGLGIVSPLLPVYADNLGATGFWVGMIFSGFAAARAIFMPIVGRISDRSGRKKFIVAGLLAYAALSLGYVAADSVYVLTAVRFLHGIASAMVVPIAMAYIGDLSKKGEEGSYMAKFQISFFVGLGSGPFLGGILNDTFGLSSAFYMMAGLSTIAFLFVAALLPETEKSAQSQGKERVSLRHAFTQPVVLDVLAFTALNAVVRGVILVFMPLFAAQIGIVPAKVGLILTVSIFLMALFQIPFGRMADRGHAIRMILAGSLLAAVSLAAIPFSQSFSELFLIACVNGLGSAILMPAVMSLTVKLGKTIGMGTSMGAYNTAMSFGMITAPLAGGLVMDHFSTETVFFLGGSVGVSVTIAAYFLTRNMLGSIETV